MAVICVIVRGHVCRREKTDEIASIIYIYNYYIAESRIECVSYAPVNVKPHLPPPGQ